MGKKNKSRKKKRIRPYKAVKLQYVEMPNPFGDIPLEEQRAILSDMSAKARAEFDEKYPKTAEWFTSYDALYLLSHCALVYLAEPAGTDREAVEGKLDFASFHLELLQAFALTRSRCESGQLLEDKASELKRHLKDVSEALKFADMDFSADIPEAEFHKRMILHRMRDQTFAVRHWAYPDQMLAHLKDLFAGSLSSLIAEEYRGVSIPRLIDAMAKVAEQIEDRMNNYRDTLRAIFFAKDFEQAVAIYKSAFPAAPWTEDQLREALLTSCEGDLQKLKIGLLSSAEAWLGEIYSFKLEDVVGAYGQDCAIESIRNIL